MNHWVMDYETLKNCFVGVFKHYKNNIYKTFVIHELRNDTEEFIKFLKKNIKNNEYHISFNGLGFDAQVTHKILKHYKDWEAMDPAGITEEIYAFAQDAITRSNNREFQEFPEWNMLIKQIDVFKLNHWDNMAKRSSLKWIEYTMDWDNILDMPIHHEADITTQQELNTFSKCSKAFKFSLFHIQFFT